MEIIKNDIQSNLALTKRNWMSNDANRVWTKKDSLGYFGGLMIKKAFFLFASLLLSTANFSFIEDDRPLEMVTESPTTLPNARSYFDLDILDGPYGEPVEFSGVKNGNDINANCVIYASSGIRTKTIENNYSDNSFFVSNVRLSEGCDEGWLEIRYTSLGHTFSGGQTVYISKTNWGCFLSLRSIDHTNYNARLWGVQNNAITQQEYDEINAAKNMRFIEKTLRGDQQPYDGGCQIQWESDSGVIKPIRGAEASFVGESGSITTYSDANGMVLCSELNLLSIGFQAKARISARTGYGAINPVENTSGSYSSQNLLSYYFDLPLDVFLSCQTITVRSTVDDSPSLLGRAFGVSQAVYYGGRYFEEMEGYRPDFVNVRYPSNGSGAVHYNLKGIEIPECTYNFWDVILHEYGHSVQRIKNISLNPGGQHFINTHFSQNEGWNGTKESGLKLVWGEAWPTVFGNLVTKKYCDELVGLSRIGDDEYNSDSYDTNLNSPSLVEDRSRLYGEGSEETTMAVLFDLFDDDRAEEFDSIALGHQGLWDLVMSSEAKTFSEFAEFCYGTNQVDNDLFARITGHYGMSVKGISIDNVEDYNTINSPIISWEKCNKDYNGQNFGSNRYDIEFLNEDGVIVHSQSGLTKESYTPGAQEWRSIQASSERSLRIRLTAYQNNHGYETGGYLSNVFELSLPDSDIHHSASYLTSTRLLEDSVEILPFSELSYQMRSSTEGRRVFQTFGPNDTVMKIYKKVRIPIIIGRTFGVREEWVLIAEDDDSGYSLNSLITIDCLANTDYRICVRNYNEYSRGRSRLVINQIAAGVEISDYSDFNNYTMSSGMYMFMNLNRYCSSAFTVRPSCSMVYEISITSGIDSFLYVLDPSSGDAMACHVEYDDDSNGNMDAKIRVDLSDQKDYYVLVTQFNPSEDVSDTGMLCIRFN